MSIYGIQIRLAASAWRKALSVFGPNIGSFGIINFTIQASITININEKTKIPIYHLGNPLRFEKNRYSKYNDTSMSPVFMTISDSSIGAQSGLYAS